jgi:hypothetical protein
VILLLLSFFLPLFFNNDGSHIKKTASKKDLDSLLKN